MDFFASLGLNTGIVFATVGISECIKGLDTKYKFKRFYLFIPVILSIAAGVLMTDPLAWRDAFINVFMYLGITTFAYGFIKKVLHLKMSDALKGNN